MVSLDLEIVCTILTIFFQSPVTLGGYFIPMHKARALAAALGLSIDSDNPINNAHLESKFNDWLARMQKFNILAAVVTWPKPVDDDAGVIFIMRFERREPEVESLQENTEALEVKRDIEGWSQKVESKLQWASFADHYGITSRGTRPRLNQLVFVECSWDELMAPFS